MDEFPGNSRKERVKEEKVIERVTQGEAVRRKKSLGKRFKETFVGGDAKSVWAYVAFDVLIPAAKDMIADAGSQGLERLIFGESRYRPRSRHSGPGGYVSYNRFSTPSRGGGLDRDREQRREVSRRARSSHDFDEIVLESRGEAEEVIDRLFDLVSRYESATVADLYELTGINGNYTDEKWGWTDIRGAGVSRVHGGYLLDLPRPEPLD
jgi:hypothetical protein